MNGLPLRRRAAAPPRIRSGLLSRTAGPVVARDLAVLVALSLLLLGLVALAPSSPLSWLRIVLGIPYVLFFPGYCLQAALFTPRDSLDSPQRIALAFGLSVAIIPPLALLLDHLPWGIRQWPILMSLLPVIVIASLAALVRRCWLPLEQQPVLALAVDLTGFWRKQDRTNRVLYLVFTGAILTAFTSAGFIMFLPKPGERFTEFYMVGTEGMAESYPRQTVAGQAMMVTVGIVNHEGVPATYSVLAKSGGQTVGIGSPRHLPPGGAWEESIAFTLPVSGDDQLVELLLYRDVDLDTRAEAYRRLRLWTNVYPAPVGP